jgi:hypothetical protein
VRTSSICRAREDVFGSTPSDSTVLRTFQRISPETQDAPAEAFAGDALQHLAVIRCDQGQRTGHLGHRHLARRGAYRVQGGDRPALQGWLGYQTMFFFADATREVLLGLLRPGNAGANTVADHLFVLDSAVSQLPAEIASEHRVR